MRVSALVQYIRCSSMTYVYSYTCICTLNSLHIYMYMYFKYQNIFWSYQTGCKRKRVVTLITKSFYNNPPLPPTGCGVSQETDWWVFLVDSMPLMFVTGSGYIILTIPVSCPWYLLELPSFTRYREGGDSRQALCASSVSMYESGEC